METSEKDSMLRIGHFGDIDTSQIYIRVRVFDVHASKPVTLRVNDRSQIRTRIVSLEAVESDSDAMFWIVIDVTV
jgi:hypothetical protein